MKRLLALALTVLTGLCSAAFAQEEELLMPDEAFRFSLEAVDANTVRAVWDVADGYYMYRSKIGFQGDGQGVELGEPRFPAGKVKKDEFFGEVETYRGHVAIDIPLERSATAATTLRLTANSQGCADIGVCYPPHRQTAEVRLAALETTPAPALALLQPAAADSGYLSDGDVLDPEVAFIFSAEVVDPNTLRARWDIAPAHYLYREKFTFELKGADGITLGAPAIPQGEEKHDEFFGDIQIFHDRVEVLLPLERARLEPAKVTLVAGYQGCAEAGICYPPMKKETGLKLPAATTAKAAVVAAPVAPPARSEPISEQDSLAQSLASGSTVLTLATFFGLGLLLAFTPCVFPMIPILSSIIVGQGAALTTRKAFGLSAVYVVAMAATYAVAGVIAGLFGANLQAAFQNPWVLGSFAAVFVALAFSMFGFYELQLPSALQSRVTAVSNRQQGGTVAGVAVMGVLSALIVGPCVAPPLMGALIYIGQTGDGVLGGLALFVLALGMGIPLLAVGTASGKLMPRAGGWMNAVKAVFGVLLLAVAIWMLERILPAFVTMLLWALLLIISAVYMGALEAIRDGASGWKRLWKGIGLVLLIYGGLLLVGTASGGRDPLEPLLHLRSVMGGGVANAQPAHLQFERIKSVADLERAVKASAARGQPVMLDFYADWCISCKEMEKYTFSDGRVAAALAGTRLLQADVTANDDTDKALLKSLGLIGPPAILFYGADGQEKRNFRVVGFKGPEEFAAHVGRALGR